MSGTHGLSSSSQSQQQEQQHRRAKVDEDGNVTEIFQPLSKISQVRAIGNIYYLLYVNVGKEKK